MARILQIEDNSDIQEILFHLLSEEHEVLQAYSGTEGLRIFQEEMVDLVLLDIMLPGLSGAEVLREIRQKSQVPVIMLTALGDKKLVAEYLMNGANDYIVKPFDLGEVLARISVQLRSMPESNEVGRKLTLLPDTFEAAWEEQSIRLGKKEYLLLKTLMSQPKKIFTKEELYELVWQEPFLVGDNTLNAQLSNLRKKLAQLAEEEEFIETIWGLGVRFKGEK